MASSSSSTGSSGRTSSGNRTYRSFFVDDEANESDASDEAEHENTIDERLWQKQESVPLRKRGQRNFYETMIHRLEADAMSQGERREEHQSSSVHHGTEALVRRSTSPSPPVEPPLAYEEITVETCTGPATIRLPLVQHEDELSREQRIFSLEADVQKTREREEISRMAARIRATHPEMRPRGHFPNYCRSALDELDVYGDECTEDLNLDESSTSKITRNIPSVDNINDVEMQPSINAEQAMRRLPTPDVPDHDQVRYDNDGNFDNEETRFMLFRVRCFRSLEADAFTKISDDIAANRVSPFVLRAVYKALQPGYLYIEAQSMLPRNTLLAMYLRSVPGLVYLSSPKITFANEKAWSRKHERVKKPPRPTWCAPDLNMPIYQNITDVGFHPESQMGVGLPPGSWVVPSNGRYKGDVGLVVEDDYDAVDTSVSALVLFIPRIKFPNSPSSKRPAKATLSVDFRKAPNHWQDFEYRSQIQSWCIRDDCSDALNCQHQPYLQKRYEIFGQVIRGGFALLVFNISELRLITRMPMGVHAVFLELPVHEDLWRDLLIRLPPPESWFFTEGDRVSFTHRFGMTGSLLARCDLADLPIGVVGTILKIHQYVCDVDLHERGHRSIPMYNLIKTIDVGQSVKISDTVGTLQEVKRVELGESALSSVSASRVVLAGRDGLVTRRYEVPPYGESLDIWVQDLELVITLDPNSVIKYTDDQVYSREFTPSAPRRVFDEFSAVEKQQVLQRPSMPYHKWNSVAHYDLRNATSVKESAWLLQNNRPPIDIHPLKYYALGRFRPPGRLPWFGVRVTADLGDCMASGEVRDVVPQAGNLSEFQVLVASYDHEGNMQSSWFDYRNVRRDDNHGLLHEFSAYTGQAPWKGIRVQVIRGPFKESGVGTVKDVSVDSNPNSISGLLLEINFESGYVFGERRVGRVDYDAVRKLNHRFIHDGWSSSRPPNSYFQFKMGYLPTYSEHALQSIKQHELETSQRIESQPSPPLPPSPVSRYFRFADPRWKNAVPEDFWLLDRRISQALGSREIYVLAPKEGNDIRISLHQTSTGLELRGAKDHKGGRKNVDSIDPRILSTCPMSLKLKGSSTANGLYLICQGEHTGKLARRMNYIRTLSSDPDDDIWVLQIVQCVWLSGRALDHKESIVAHEIHRFTRQALTLVHETDKERAQANTLMATLRLQQGGVAPDFTLVDGRAQKILR